MKKITKVIKPKIYIDFLLTCFESIHLFFFYLKYFGVFKSQLGQDVWVLYRTKKLNTNRYYVDVGACYPVKLSNTFLLELSNFNGLLIEPNPNMINELKKARTADVLECAISATEKSITLNLAFEPEFSMVDDESLKEHRLFKSTGIKKVVRALTLTEALNVSNVPKIFSYLSIDIEGREYDALVSLDFNIYKPMLISVEHNYKEDRVKIEELLNRHGYIKDPAVRISKWDDFYISKKFLFESRKKHWLNF